MAKFIKIIDVTPTVPASYINVKDVETLFVREDAPGVYIVVATRYVGPGSWDFQVSDPYATVDEAEVALRNLAETVNLFA